MPGSCVCDNVRDVDQEHVENLAQSIALRGLLRAPPPIRSFARSRPSRYGQSVPDSPYTLRIEREDGELLVLEGLELVRGFIGGDPSAQPGGYDALAGTGDVNRITLEDVTTINTTMRARSKLAHWQPIVDDDQGWLEAIPPNLDIIEADDEAWSAADGTELVSAAIAGCIRPYIGLARSTKVLHLKRPGVFPVLDELVVQVMGVGLPDSPTPDERIAIAERVTEAIRREGRRNIEALRRIQAKLAEEDVQLSLVRILDIALWFAHPAASVDGAKREIRVRMRPA